MKIFLDIDDVLADTVKALEHALGPAIDPTSEHLQDFFPGVNLPRYLQDPAFNMSIPPVDGAVAGAMMIFEHGHAVQYLSARTPDLTDVTETWLRRWGFPESPTHCVGTENKRGMLALDNYDVLIDDQLKYLNEAGDRGIRALAFAYPWNQTWKGARFENWKGLSDEFTRI